MKQLAIQIVFLVISVGITFALQIVFLDDLAATGDSLTSNLQVLFSLMAASIFAVVTIVGDPAMLLPSSWRKSLENAREAQKEIHALYILFIIYIFVILLGSFSDAVNTSFGKDISYWYHLFYLFFVVFAVLHSIRLPFYISGIQTRRLELEIEKRINSPVSPSTKRTPDDSNGEI